MVVRKRDCAPATQVNALDCLAVVSTEQLQTKYVWVALQIPKDRTMFHER